MHYAMTKELPEMDFQRFWRRLQQIGLNAYEARSYMVLVGHPRFKALELAARSHVPRQKIYEVLDSLIEKGFAQVIQEKTKLFSAVEPTLAIPSFLARRGQALERELLEQSRFAEGLVNDLKRSYSEGQGERGTLDFLRIVSEPAQTASQYRRMLSEVQYDYIEFSRPPYAVDPLDEQLVKQARSRGVSCRLLYELRSVDDEHKKRMEEYRSFGVEVSSSDALPMKLAVFDGRQGMIALLDPVITKPSWTSVVFDHLGFAEAMKGMFESHWHKAAKNQLDYDAEPSSTFSLG
jgi:sugar-specific transcriptional regulator TrmB